MTQYIIVNSLDRTPNPYSILSEQILIKAGGVGGTRQRSPNSPPCLIIKSCWDFSNTPLNFSFINISEYKPLLPLTYPIP